MTMTDEETVAVATPDFGQRRWTARLRRWRALIVTAVVLAMVATATWLVMFSSVVTVRDVEVVGNHAVPAAQIERAARAPIGTPLARVDLSAVQARVEAIAAVKSVSVSRSWLHTIRIEVTERVPVAVVSRDPGTPGAGLQAVDLDGILFGSYSAAPAGLPVIRTAPGVTAEVLSEAAKVVRSLRPDLAAKVRFVDVTSIDSITLLLAHGPRVLWGSAGDSGQKADVLHALAESGGGVAFARLHEVDVSVPGRPTTR